MNKGNLKMTFKSIFIFKVPFTKKRKDKYEYTFQSINSTMML